MSEYPSKKDYYDIYPDIEELKYLRKINESNKAFINKQIEVDKLKDIIIQALTDRIKEFPK